MARLKQSMKFSFKRGLPAVKSKVTKAFKNMAVKIAKI